MCVCVPHGGGEEGMHIVRKDEICVEKKGSGGGMKEYHVILRSPISQTLNTTRILYLPSVWNNIFLLRQSDPISSIG